MAKRSDGIDVHKKMILLVFFFLKHLWPQVIVSVMIKHNIYFGNDRPI